MNLPNDNTGDIPVESADDAALGMLGGATFSSNTRVTLPSGKVIGGDEAQAMSAAFHTGGTDERHRNPSSPHARAAANQVVDDAKILEAIKQHANDELADYTHRGSYAYRTMYSDSGRSKIAPIPELPDFHGNATVPSIPGKTALFVQRGGATAAVLNGVGDGAAVVAGGGGATIKIVGDVAQGACIIASGGGANIIVMGNVADDANIQAHGGGARITIIGNIAEGARILCTGGGARITVIGRVAGRDSSLHARNQHAFPYLAPRFIRRVVQYFYRKQLAKTVLG